MMFLFFASPVKASVYEYNYNNLHIYKDGYLFQVDILRYPILLASKKDEYGHEDILGVTTVKQTEN